MHLIFPHIVFNIARLNPKNPSIQDDQLSVSAAKKSARALFWDTVSDKPQAPDLWPSNRNIPVALSEKNFPDTQMEYQHYGQDNVLAGLHYAFAMAIQLKQRDNTPENVKRVKKFEDLFVLYQVMARLCVWTSPIQQQRPLTSVRPPNGMT